uniref:DUF6314 domain-containing protein n=1 Tax=Acrobeloides nanus TaxID=290746 RepID=A0A914D338_9BILA
MLERQISDKLSNLTAKASGFATFTQKSSEELEYLEDIHVKWSSGMEHPATKHYKYILKDDVLAQYNPVTKENNEEDFERMYDLVFYHEDGKLKANGDFLCGCDMYKAEYVFDSMKKFKLSYNVKGKSKDYETITTFIKCLS